MCVCARVRACVLRVGVCVSVVCKASDLCLCARSLTNPARNAPPYYHLQNLGLHHNSGGKVTEYKMCILIFSTTFIMKHFSY